MNSVYIVGPKLENEIDFLGTNAPIAPGLINSLGTIIAGRTARA